MQGFVAEIEVLDHQLVFQELRKQSNLINAFILEGKLDERSKFPLFPQTPKFGSEGAANSLHPQTPKFGSEEARRSKTVQLPNLGRRHCIELKDQRNSFPN